MTKFLLVHAGARDNYLLYKALFESDLLEVFVTDFAHSISVFHKRYVPNDGRVKIINSFKLHRRNHVDYSLNDLSLSRKAGELAREMGLAIFAYSYYASEAFFRNQKDKNYLFQLHPHPALIRDILLNSLEAYPEYEKLVKNEDEFQMSYFHLDRECALAGQVFCASTFTKRSLHHFDRDLSVKVVPYDIPKSGDFFRSVSNGVKTGNEKLKILFIGQLTYRKGIVPLLRAISKTKKIELIIITKSKNFGPLQSEFSGVNAKFYRDLSESEKLKVMRSVDFGILPSYIEGFGHVISEFASAGIPVISSVNTGSPDIFQPPLTDLILSDVTEESILEAIEKLADNLSYYKEAAVQFGFQINNTTLPTFKSKIIEELKLK